VLAVAPLKFNTQIRLLLLRAFEPRLLETLHTQVEHANQLLIDCGYCPAIDAESVRRTRFAAPEETATPESEAHKQAAKAPTLQHAELSSEQTLEQRPTQQHKKSIRNKPQYSSISKHKLFHLIDYLQRCQLKQPLSITPLHALPLIEHLLTNRLAKHERHSLSNHHKRIVQLMDNAFHFIYSQGLPQPMLLLIAKLRLPVLKVALCDSEFLADRNHPARQLINALTAIDIDWHQNGNDTLQKGTDFIVTQLASELYGDPHLFQQLAAPLINTLKSQAERASKLEVRVIQSEQGKDKTDHTRRLVNQLLNDRLQGKRIHPECRTFLLGPWQQVLFQQSLKYGDHSSEARSALSLTQKIISLSCGRASASIPDLSDLMDSIQQRLNHTIADEQQVTKHIQQLESAFQQTCTDTSNGPLAYPTFDQTHLEPATLADEWIPQSLKDPDNLLFSDLLKQVEQLSPGAWFQFTSKGTPPQRYKFASRLAFSNNLLFTHINGQKTKTLSMEQLASQLYKTEATPVHSGPLFDRALRDATNQFRSEIALQSVHG